MLIKCPECGKVVSDRAKQCIHCGFPLEEMTEVEKVKVSKDISATNEAAKNKTIVEGKVLDATSQKQPANQNVLYDITLVSFEPREKIKVIKKIIKITKLGLSDAKNSVENLPYTFANGITAHDTNIIKQEFAGLSATIQVSESDNKSATKTNHPIIPSNISENKTKPNTVDTKGKEAESTDNQNGAIKNDSQRTRLYDIELKSYDLRNKDKIIREVKLITGMEYGEAKRTVESIPVTIVENLSKEDCRILKARFSELTASVSIIPSKGQKTTANELEYLKKLSVYQSSRSKSNTNHTKTIESTDDKKQNKKINAIILVSAILFCIVIAGAASYYNRQSEEQAYNHAVELLESNNKADFERAIDQLKLVADKKENEIQKICIQHIHELCDAEEYDRAVDDLYEFSSASLISGRDDLEKYINYRKAETTLEYDNIIEAYNLFINLGDYNDSSERAGEVFEEHKDVFYNNAVAHYEKGKFDNAQYVFGMLGDYKDSEKYLERINFRYQIGGTYKSEDGDIIILRDDKVLDYGRSRKYLSEYDAEIIEIDGTICLYCKRTDDAWYLEDTDAVCCFVREGKNGKQKLKRFETLTLLSRNTANLKPPQIGMTSEELSLSTWGDPETVNRSTYSWGTSEQWCYEGYKYVYLDNGVVTSIQD